MTDENTQGECIADEDYPIMLDMTIGEGRALFAQIVRARNSLRGAIEEQNIGDVGYYFGWLDALLTRVADATPAKVKKPPEKSALSGGGDKP